ncbi:prolyl hydroxylase family protein [Steroidobacter sp.]|uniref:prolyl hydroxylase family protein n=1 Tax=Steroidobacter sp. TaxID=1978227 RepID=UPI001A42912B|nr:2OG-Fe(II) oxygenase [Steroidobacter sp.]MBL8271205.1 2OG-Fe(II) oxygenase [Steroidobacter sp.]
MKLQDGVLIQRNALRSDDLGELSRYVQRASISDSPVSSFESDPVEGEVEWVVNKQVRDTQHVKLTKAMAQKLRAIDDASIASIINPFYRVEVGEREPSQILHYGVGGHYIPHVDAETLYKDDDGLELWEKTLDRDLSVVYFINDDFAGGELFFPALDLVIEPEAGTLVCFPSDHNYIHGVRPVTSGHRYTIVTWMRVLGMPERDEINQTWMDEYHRQRPKQVEQSPRLGKGKGVIA